MGRFQGARLSLIFAWKFGGGHMYFEVSGFHRCRGEALWSHGVVEVDLVVCLCGVCRFRSRCLGRLELSDRLEVLISLMLDFGGRAQ